MDPKAIVERLRKEFPDAEIENEPGMCSTCEDCDRDDCGCDLYGIQHKPSENVIVITLKGSTT